LGLDDYNLEGYKESADFNLHSHGEVVYPSVCKALGIDKSIAMTRRIKPGSKVEYTFREYICAYVDMANQKKEKCELYE
jgi:hypothetical protein